MKRIPAACVLLILLALPAWAATKYVDCGADPGGDGTTQELTGVHCAWDAVADVNGASFSPGDSILFKRGCTWREQLTVPSSGSAGLPITFGAYGTGAKPIISGADLVTTWALLPATETGGIFVANAEDGGTADFTGVTVGGTTTFAASSASKNNGAYGYEVTSDGTNDGIAYKTVSAENDFYCRIYLKMKTGFAINTDVKTVSPLLFKDAGGTVRARLNLRRAGTGFELGAIMPWGGWGSIAYTPITAGAWHRIEMRFLVHGSTGGIALWLDGASVGTSLTTNTTGYATARIDAGLVNVDGIPVAGSVLYLDDIKADTAAVGSYYGSSGNADVYIAAAAWTPYVVIEDGTKLANVASVAAITSVGKWYSDGASCYVRTTDSADPDTHTMEVGTRTYSVYGTGKAYVTVDGLDCTGANDGGVFWEGGGNYWTAQNCAVKNIGRADWGSGIRMRGGTHNLVSGNEVSYCYRGINIEDYGNPAPDLNTIRGNDVHDIDSNGITAAANTPSSITITLIEKNRVYNCVLTLDDNGGISIYQVGAGTVVRYNAVYNNGTASARGSGINLDTGSAATECHGNVVYGNNYGGINMTADGHKIYGNTCYHNNEATADAGEISIFSGGANMLIKNNIMVASTGKQILVAGAGNTTGHAIDYNEWYGGSATPFTWGAANYNFANYKAASSQDAHSLNSDPLFTNAAAGDFTLAAGSLCIDAGVELGDTYQTALMPGSNWPAAVLTASQYNAAREWASAKVNGEGGVYINGMLQGHGTGSVRLWDIGAYLYPSKAQSLVIGSR
jgi:parallel beta-helix repeat protein